MWLSGFFNIFFLCKKWKTNAILVRVSRIEFKTGWDKIYIFSRPVHWFYKVFLLVHGN